MAKNEDKTMKKISWGVLSAAKIGVEKVIPAMQKGKYSTITAIASRSVEKAQSAARRLTIPKAYGAYEELLADREIDAIYNPLPNHLHVEWTIKALEAGKHVLCEKPIGMNLQEAVQLQQAAQEFPKLKLMEAFMYRHHPQWAAVKELLKNGNIGQLKSIHAVFTYYNVDPANIRNQADIGGGGLLDIGCYCISASRFLFNSEPIRVCGTLEYDPQMKIDRLASGVLEFEKGTATFTCSTQMADYQHVCLFGASGRMEIPKPFTPSPGQSCKIIKHSGAETDEITIAACDQYTRQGDLFSQAILNDTSVPTPFEDAVANMRVIDAILASHQKRAWVEI
jgi:predicted dehydrogenase